MRKFFDGVNNFFVAEWWSGASWLLVLILLLLGTTGIYLGTHNKPHYGYEFVSLNVDQQKAFNDIVGVYTDGEKPTSMLVADTIEEAEQIPAPATHPRLDAYRKAVSIRIKKAEVIDSFLTSTLQGDVKAGAGRNESSILEQEVHRISPTLLELNTKDVTAFVFARKFKADSYFWLAGMKMYWEAIFWSLFGVLVSLIYYVSTANKLEQENKEDQDIGPFKTSEISGQVAKMFYAPAVTIVIVLGYSFFAGRSQTAIDISVNHGLILFAFTAGFYSGRLMKLLDKLKDAILPFSDNQSPAKDSGGKGDVKVTPKLSDAVANSPEGPWIKEAGFNAATVTLEPTEGSGTPITLDKPANDKDAAFTGKQVPYGKYTVRVKYAYDDKQHAVINLTANQDIEVGEKSLAFTVELNKETGT